MKVSKCSWHYRFIDRCGFYPETCATKVSYIGTFIGDCFWCFIAFGWIAVLHGILKEHCKLERVEFYDDDDEEEERK